GAAPRTAPWPGRCPPDSPRCCTARGRSPGPRPASRPSWRPPRPTRWPHRRPACAAPPTPARPNWRPPTPNAPASPRPPPNRRRTAHTRAADLAPDDAERARQYTAAAEQALLAGDSPAALRLLDAARSRPVPTPVRGRTELLRGRVLLADGPVDDARESFLLAA